MTFTYLFCLLRVRKVTMESDAPFLCLQWCLQVMKPYLLPFYWHQHIFFLWALCQRGAWRGPVLLMLQWAECQLKSSSFWWDMEKYSNWRRSLVLPIKSSPQKWSDGSREVNQGRGNQDTLRKSHFSDESCTLRQRKSGVSEEQYCLKFVWLLSQTYLTS